jgi:hypothetical protein
MERHGNARQDMGSKGKERQRKAWSGMAWKGKARKGKERQGMAWKEMEWKGIL